MATQEPPLPEREDFLLILSKSINLLIEFDDRRMFDSAARMSETIDTLRRHPWARENDFDELDSAALNCLAQHLPRMN